MSEELEIHPSHMPEPSDKKILAEESPVICMRCCYFVEIRNNTTPKGAAECKPMKIGLRDAPSFRTDALHLRIETILMPIIGDPSQNKGHIHWAW